MGKERETRFSLTSGRTRWQRPADPTSHGEQHSFISLSENRNHTNFRWTRNPPENPATELDTNSTPNAPNQSSVQQIPAGETPQVPESAVLVVCHSSDEHHISPDILTISSQTPVPQLRGDLIEKGIARKFYLSIIIERHISRSPSRYGSRHYSNVYRTPRGSSRKNKED